MEGFHEHVSKSRLYQSALNICFTQDETRILELRVVDALQTAGADRSRQVPSEVPSEPPAVQAVAASETIEQNKRAGRAREDEPVHVNEDVCAAAVSSPACATMSPSRLRNLANKVTKAKSHVDFLSTCARKLLPKGFQLKWSCHFEDDDITADVLDRASFDLVKACRQLASKKLSSLRKDYERGWSELASILPAEELSRLSVQLSRDRQRIPQMKPENCETATTELGVVDCPQKGIKSFFEILCNVADAPVLEPFTGQNYETHSTPPRSAGRIHIHPFPDFFGRKFPISTDIHFWVENSPFPSIYLRQL